ncbi:MAG: hypothetical protein R3E82_15840 [Pseudomonadales bacterium]|nr:hypothetical protein [Pseudomonadales bacterium]
MPFLQVMSNRASEAFSFDRIQELKVRVQPNTDLGNLLGRLGIVQTAQERAALRAFPKSIKDSLLAVIRRALEPPAGERLQITVSWAPAYEYGVHIWEARSVCGSPSAITIHLEGPYPEAAAEE